MIDLKEILEEWKEECKINPNKLDDTSRETPMLHAKYLSILSNARLQIKQAEWKQKVLLKQKWLWYNGKMHQDEIEKLGWNPDPFDGLKILKGEYDYYYNADPEIVETEAKIQYLKEVAEVLKEIVDTLKWRHQNIGNMIKWQVFQAGG